MLFATPPPPAPVDTVPAAHAAAKAITAKGVGGVRIGMRYTTLLKRGLIGHIRPGCELGGPSTRSAPLRSGVKGTVNFTLTSPRRVTDITVRGGAAARGVGIGAKPGHQGSVPQGQGGSRHRRHVPLHPLQGAQVRRRPAELRGRHGHEERHAHRRAAHRGL
jgi:hypothetical protein